MKKAMITGMGAKAAGIPTGIRWTGEITYRVSCAVNPTPSFAQNTPQTSVDESH